MNKTIMAIDQEEQRIMDEMSMMNVGSEEYANAAKARKTLAETKTEENKSKISAKVVIENGLKIFAGLFIIVLGTTHIIDDKAERISDRLIPKER